MKYILLIICLLTGLAGQFTAVKANSTLKIDGLLEAEWDRATKIESFHQYDPDFNKPATQQIEAYFLYDEENIYVAAKVYQSESRLKSNRYRRDTDALFSGDWFQVNLDPFNQGFIGYYIGINPSNAVIDGKVGSGSEDKSFDFIFHSQTKIYSDYWTVEIQIPLDGIDFQNKDIQTWGVAFFAHFSHKSERNASYKLIKEDVFRMSNYHKFHQLKGLRKKNPFSFVPYQYYSEHQSFIKDRKISGGKVGYELKYQPNSETTLLMTVNPDFAQIETDAEVINVTDQPTSYPEKRPFFTYNSDMYKPASAVRTRNIKDIDIGLKYIKEVDQYKYDLTAVLDKDNTKWLLGDFRITNPNHYKLELIGGARKSDALTASNLVLNTEYYILNKTLRFWQYIEYSSLNDQQLGWFKGVSYRTREWNIQLFHDSKPADYHSGKIGVWLQSNKYDTEASIARTFYFNNSFLVSLHPKIKYERIALHSHTSEVDNEYSFELGGRIRPTKELGTWNFGININPNTGQRFRYRGSKLTHEFNDTFYASHFSLVKQGFTDINFWWGTDRSKVVSINGWGWTGSSRNAPTTQVQNTLSIRPSSDVLMEYVLNLIDVEGSYYSNKFQQYIHRFKLEYNLTDKFNIRGIYQFNDLDDIYVHFDEEDVLREDKPKRILREPTVNLTTSWEYSPGSFFYVVLNKHKGREAKGDYELEDIKDNYSIILKINKTFQF